MFFITKVHSEEYSLLSIDINKCIKLFLKIIIFHHISFEGILI